MKSCTPKYIKDNFANYPNLAERLTNIHDNIWNRIIDSDLFRKYGDIYLFSKPNTEQNNKQIDLISKIKKEFNIPESSKVIKSAPTQVGNNMKVLVNVSSLAQQEWNNNEGKQQTLFQNNNNEQNNNQEELPFQKVESFNESNISIKKGVDDIFKQSPELANIGSTQQYSQYLDSIFPNSKIKDIVYHGSNEKIETFDFNKKINKLEKGLFFFQKQKSAQLWRDASFQEDNTQQGSLISAIIDLKNPKVENFEDKSAWEMQKYSNKNIVGDGLIANNVDEMWVGRDTQYAVFNPEQIHILGNKQDIEGFNNWVKEDIYKSDNRDDQKDGSEQDELGYIDEQNDDTKDFIDQKDVSLLSEEDIKINNKIDELLNNGDIIQYCQ